MTWYAARQINESIDRPGMDDTAGYYRQFATEFFESTVGVDMSTIRDRFASRLKVGARILDAGCGSGRDAKAFAELGFQVTAFDASPEIAALASMHCGFEVGVRRFDEVTETEVYDGIWCCASLLHVDAEQMTGVLGQLWSALAPGGVLYASFKSGTGERAQGGRRFTDADESRVRHWTAQLANVQHSEFWTTDDQRPGRSETWTNVLISKGISGSHKLVTGGRNQLLPCLSGEIARASQIDFAVAFVFGSGLRLLWDDLKTVLQRSDVDGKTLLDPSETSCKVRVLTSDYLDVTEPEALRLLLLLKEMGADVRVFVTDGESFHLKAYIFSSAANGVLTQGTAFIGSSNISRRALRDGLEWNYRVTYPEDAGFLEAKARFDELFMHPKAEELTDAWIDSYERRRAKPGRLPPSDASDQDPPPAPTAIQANALAALAESRHKGFRRGVVVLATGLGKTWLAAFDVAAVGARRVLFVAHRDEILAQAAATFVRIRPEARVGFYMGRTRDAEVDVLCASVQTLARAEHLERFSPQHFDYVVVDEFHHADAPTYRRLLTHFAPSFLLGLPATPDRTDQSDILALCDENLVYSQNLFDGISQGLLAPFHYYGILDESIDYREVPWRNGRFDPESLSNKLATLSRGRHVLKEWKSRAQRHTLAFCVSKRHADFMADQFGRAGIPCAAVYAGSSLGRTQALEQLETGELHVLFSVDLFNEGVDLPCIDTVMMLRPTESKILFLQQLGRGLRRSEGKSHLVVLDFIGNHQSFLQKPQALFDSGSTYHALAEFARRYERGELELPEGCYVNYDLGIIEFLKALNDGGPGQDFEALRAVLGRRPTLTEFYRAGGSLVTIRRQFGAWFQFVDSMAALEPAEVAALSDAADLLRDIETTAMTKSFKMVLLEAFLELDGLSRPVPVATLTQRSRAVLQRRPPLLSDLPTDMREAAPDSSEWARYWLDNPIRAWIHAGSTKQAEALFEVDGGMFWLAKPVPSELASSLADLMQELVDFRLATYEGRVKHPEAPEQVSPAVQSRAAANELAFFPNLKIACGHFKAGRTDAEEHLRLPASYGKLDPARHFIAKASGSSMDGGKNPIRDGDYLLLELISPSKAGSITGTVMAIERQDDVSGDNQYLLRVVTKSRTGQYILKANNPDYEDLEATDDMRTLARLKSVIDPLDLALWQAFAREDIPALFGEVYSPGNWNSGHVTLNGKQVHVLLVTLNKRGRAKDHRYLDHWIDPHSFHWQSQNATTPESKRGQEIIQQRKRGIAIHLFVRDEKLAGGKAAPFIYFGAVAYRSHQGSGPMSVVFDVPGSATA